MKKISLVLSLVLLFACIQLQAQKKIHASDIMHDIKNGKNIVYKNATIVGVLDFTFMEEALTKLPKRRTGWFSNGGNNTIKKRITNKIRFENCVFQDPVFAYIHDEDSGYTFTANFSENVAFTDCTFNEMALFKYSTFYSQTDFSNTKFRSANTFKYADFKHKADFTKAEFNESANFKYAKFNKGLSFKNTRFKDDLNIKYSTVSGKFEISGMDVAYDVDSKYTRINGEKFRYNRK